MASGVKVHEDCKHCYVSIQQKKSHRYIIYRLDKNLKEIIVEKKAERCATFDDFVEDLAEAERNKECRYGIYDCEFESKEGHQKKKLAFVFWAPETATIKQKMVYSSSKDALKGSIGGGIAGFVQANDMGDLTWDAVVEKCNQNARD